MKQNIQGDETSLGVADAVVLQRNAHIPTDEIERDIADTEYEIATMTREMEGFRMVGDRMSMFRADARRDGIENRKRLLEKLQNLLRLRTSESKGSN